MLVSVLASGSEGNSTYIETDSIKLLIDIGTTNKNICTKLEELGVKSNDINYIVMTHTHSDHTGALKTFIKHNSPYIVVTEGMKKELDMLNDYENLIITDKDIEVGDTKIIPFKTSHDAVDSRGFLIEDKNSSAVYMTDTGYLNQKYFELLYNKDVYIIEANHDVEMLMNGSYPKWLKSRIFSDEGHLSNNSAGFYLAKLIGPNTKKVYLAHLSKENNTEIKALKTVKETLSEYNINFDNIEICKQKSRTGSFQI